MRSEFLFVSLRLVLLIYWHCFGPRRWCCLSFGVHCFTFIRFIYRSLPVTDWSVEKGWTQSLGLMKMFSDFMANESATI